MQLKCEVCGQTEKLDRKVRKNFADIAYEDIGWIDSCEELPPLEDKEYWRHSSETPQKGTHRILQVSYPFSCTVGEMFNTLFVPQLSLLNGWSQHPEEIEKSAIVSCRFEKIVDKNEYYAWICVEILEVIKLPDLYKIYSPRVDERPLEKSDYSVEPDIFEYKNWSYYIYSIQGDLGQWKLIYTDEDGVRHLILMGDWDFHRNAVYYGNIISNGGDNGKSGRKR